MIWLWYTPKWLKFEMINASVYFQLALENAKSFHRISRSDANNYNLSSRCFVYTPIRPNNIAGTTSSGHNKLRNLKWDLYRLHSKQEHRLLLFSSRFCLINLIFS